MRKTKKQKMRIIIRKGLINGSKKHSISFNHDQIEKIEIGKDLTKTISLTMLAVGVELALFLIWK